ncbi:hypothetical protein BCR33DRAFT_722685, partial [Rhizoclosmatium globosum]
LKIVLSTNIAESSVTISDVSCVIDHGLRRSMEYNTQLGCQTLKLGFVTGRSGRCRAGLYLAFFTQQYHDLIFKVNSSQPTHRTTLHHTTHSSILETFDAGALTRPPGFNPRFLRRSRRIENHKSHSSEASQANFPVILASRDYSSLALHVTLQQRRVCLQPAYLCRSFSMPTSYFTHNRAELCVQLAASFGSRVEADSGGYSEPGAILNLFKEWVKVGCSRCKVEAVTSGDFGIAGRLGEVLRVRVEEEGSRVGNKVVERLMLLKDVAGEVLSGSGGGRNRDVVDEIFCASENTVRAVLLAGCSQEIYHGQAGEAGLLGLDDANTILAKAKRAAGTGAKAAKLMKKSLEAQLTAQLFSNASKPISAYETMTVAANSKAHLLNLFYKHVPPSPTAAATSVVDPTRHKSASIVIIAKFAPPELSNAASVRKMFEWMGCVRACVVKRFVVLEFLERHEDIGERIESLLGKLEVRESATNESEADGFEVKTQGFGGVYAVKPNMTSQERVVQLSDSRRDVLKTTTKYETNDLCMALRFLSTLSIGRKHTWMPYPEYGEALEKEEGVELGKVVVGFQVDFRKCKTPGLSVKPYWRSPFIGSAGMTERQELDKNGDWKVISKRVEEFDATTCGNSVFAAAGSSQLIENANSSFLGVTGITLYPANQPVWNLRLLMLKPNDASILLTGENRGVSLHHFHASHTPDIDSDVVQWIETNSSLGGGSLEPQDLEVLNEGRSDIGRLFYDGSGLVEGKLAKSYHHCYRRVGGGCERTGRRKCTIWRESDDFDDFDHEFESEDSEIDFACL